MLARGAARRSRGVVRRALGASPLAARATTSPESVCFQPRARPSHWRSRLDWSGTSSGSVDVHDADRARISTDWRMLAFTAVSMIATTILFGLVPALRAEPSRQRRLSSRRTGWAEPAPAKAACRSRDCCASGGFAPLTVRRLLVRSFERLAAPASGFERDQRHRFTFNSPSVPRPIEVCSISSSSRRYEASRAWPAPAVR